jgi:hypothetical protein
MAVACCGDALGSPAEAARPDGKYIAPIANARNKAIVEVTRLNLEFMMQLSLTK